MDGLYESINKISWSENSTRYIFHIGDAPPHGKHYYPSNDWMNDRFPDGCPCGIKIETLAA